MEIFAVPIDGGPPIKCEIGPITHYSVDREEFEKAIRDRCGDDADEVIACALAGRSTVNGLPLVVV